MIQVLILLALVFAAGAAAAVLMGDQNGYVLLSYGHWTLETSVVIFVVSLVIALLLLNYGLRLLLGTLRLPTRVRSAYDQRRQRLARESCETGLLDWLSGRWHRAEVELVRRAADHDAGGLNMLLAAQAAHHSGETERRDHYLRLALEREDPQLRFAARLLRARIAIDDGDYAYAQERLPTLREEAPRHSGLVELSARLYRESGDWEALRKLLIESERMNVFAPAQFRALLIEASHRGLTQAAASGRLDAAKALWAQTPTALRGEREVRNAYIRALAQLNAHAEAAALIANVLKTEWDAELVQVFSALSPPDGIGALASVEQWLNQYGERPELLYAAARACLDNKLWGKARAYLEAGLRMRPDAATYLELARLIERSPEGGDADAIYREGLAAAVKPPV